MPILRWITVLWPGLPQAWLRGDISALLLAVGFSALLNLTVVASWVWIDLLSTPMLVVAWGGVVLFWLVSTTTAAVQMPALLQAPSPSVTEDLFRTAQREYLRGSWFEAELALNRLLEHDPNDADAWLMLAALTRRIGQTAEARERLRRLVTLDGAGRWQPEIAREWQLLDSPPATAAQNVQHAEAAGNRLPNAA